jgi:hypothetical protein
VRRFYAAAFAVATSSLIPLIASSLSRTWPLVSRWTTVASVSCSLAITSRTDTSSEQAAVHSQALVFWGGFP